MCCSRVFVRKSFTTLFSCIDCSENVTFLGTLKSMAGITRLPSLTFFDSWTCPVLSFV